MSNLSTEMERGIPTTAAWQAYEQCRVELKEYDPSWPKLYAEEVRKIKSCFDGRYGVSLAHVDTEHRFSRGEFEEILYTLVKMNYQFQYQFDLEKALKSTGYDLSLVMDCTLIKKGFMVHIYEDVENFIGLRDYLRTHPEACYEYSKRKRTIVDQSYGHRNVREYTSEKGDFLQKLLNNAIQWYREHLRYAHIGRYDETRKEWTCCHLSTGEKNIDGHSNGWGDHIDAIGCYRPGSMQTSYHPGRFRFEDYSFTRGKWTCCPEGRYSDGCIKVVLLSTGDALLTDIARWTVDEVCRWVRSLQQINKDYSEKFRAHAVTGDLLLTLLDSEVLQDFGVLPVLHRRLFLKAIDDLKKQSTSDTSLNSSSLKTELNKLYYDQFEGDFNPLLSVDEVKDTTSYPNVSVCTLTNEKHRNLISRIYNWIGGVLPSNYKIDEIEFVFNPGRYRMFLQQLESVESKQQQPAFQPKLSIENSPEERKQVLSRLDALCQQVSHNRSVRIVRMWHGCQRNILPNLLSDGFSTLGFLDDGWFGKAMYFTSSAKYATRYCGQKGGCLIMCYILLLNPFPVVKADAPPAVSPHQFRFYGKGNYKNYQCHYIPVSPVGEPNTADYRPPSSGNTDDALYDELAVFQEANILPQIVIHFK